MAKNEPAATEAPTEKQKRKARKLLAPSRYILQTHDTDGGWRDSITEPNTFDDTAAAKKHVRDNQMEGVFRVIRVVASFTAATETKKVTKIS